MSAFKDATLMITGGTNLFGKKKIEHFLKSQNKQSERNYGIDALRIVSMFMIVVLHVIGHGGLLWANEYFTIKFNIIWLLEIMAFCSVNCYALISGYIGVFSKHSYSNLALLWIRVLFYTVTIAISFKVFLPTVVSSKDIILSFFPTMTNQYWYFSSYVILFLFIPILNHGLNCTSKKSMTVILLITLVIACVFEPVFKLFIDQDIFALKSGYSSLWLMIMYLVGGFIRKYNISMSKSKSLLLYFSTVFVVWIYKIGMQYVTDRLIGKIKYDNLFMSYNSILMFFAAIALLLFFKDLKTNCIAIYFIRYMSPLSFSVYLIHENEFIRSYFMVNKFYFFNDFNLIVTILMIFAAATAIYLICSALDIIRESIFKALKLKKRFYSIESKIKQVFESA